MFRRIPEKTTNWTSDKHRGSCHSEQLSAEQVWLSGSCKTMATWIAHPAHYKVSINPRSL